MQGERAVERPFFCSRESGIADKSARFDEKHAPPSSVQETEKEEETVSKQEKTRAQARKVREGSN